MIDPTAAEYEPSQPLAVALLRQVVKSSEDSRGVSQTADDAYRRASRGLALEGRSPPERTSHWERACLGSQPSNARAASLRAELTVDAAQDVYATLPYKTRLEWLSAARGFLDSALTERHHAAIESELLARKASVVRQRAVLLLRTDPVKARRDIAEANRAAQKAVSIQRAPATLIQLGLAQWAAARLARSDLDYKESLTAAEDVLREAAASDRPAALALAMMLRLSFRPEEAQQAFDDYMHRDGPVRPVLRHAYVMGEACTQEWLSSEGTFLPRRHAEVEALLERAIAGGYDSARTLLSLAFVQGMRGQAGLDTLGALVLHDGRLDWTSVMESVAEGDLDTLDKALSLGIDQGATWTRLATYVVTFSADLDLAVEMSDVAARLAPGDPVVLTNHARLLLQTDTAGADIRRLLDRAAQAADRRFVWWREVRKELDGRPELSAAPSGQRYTTVDQARDYRAVTRAFRELQQGLNLSAQARGLALERVFGAACRLTVGITTSSGSYRTVRTGRTNRQFDGYLECHGHAYRVECKWLQDAVEEQLLTHFFAGIESPADAIVVSMGRYSDGAVYRAKRELEKRVVILLDRSEVESVLYNEMKLDDLIRRRRRRALHLDDPTGPANTRAPETPV